VIPTSLASAVIEPFKEFFSRQGVKNSLLILAFLVLYKLGDNMATALETPFFYDMGFSGTEIGSVAKLTKLWASVVGSLLGGYMMLRLGLARCLWIFGGFQILSILGYALLSHVGDSLSMLFVAVALEYLGVGLGTVGLLAYMSELTNRSFTATQFALLSSLATLPRTLASSSSGFIIEAVGYTQFFLICFLLAIPGMLLLLKIAPWNGRALCVFEKNSSV
jgi:PAT family beta-lactamase induction signal transducer AmpG